MGLRKGCAAVAVAAGMMAGTPAWGQFYSPGDDPGGLKWYRVDTPHYRVIYPEGTDSLARVYGAQLERFYPVEAASVGMVPGQYQRGRMPVILHAHHGTPNGSVFWAPRRMDLFTVPEAYGSDPTPWEVQLAVHESRHAAQLQLGYRGWLRPFGYLVGEAWPGAVIALYPNMALLEGDAVAAETGLSAGGRARTADFLNYFQVAFDAGDYRDWYRWCYGSYRHFTPDHYKIGYMTVAGMRYFYGDPLFSKEYYDHAASRPFSFSVLPKTVRKASRSGFRFTMDILMDRWHTLWTEEAAKRAPFMEAEPVTRPQKWYTDYTAGAFLDGNHYVLKSGLTRPKVLTALGPQGRERTVTAFSVATGSLFADPVRHRLYWSETVPDPRWSLRQTSRIRYLSTLDHRQHDLTHAGRLYNPQPAPDGTVLTAVEYPVKGGSAVAVVSADDGSILRRYPAPDGLQATECAWWGGAIYASALSEEGFGLYRIGADGCWETVLAPAIQKMQNLGTEGDRVVFVSDRDGQDELYAYDPETGKLYQRTVTRYGATDFGENGKYLYYSSQTIKGMAVFRTPTDRLPQREVSLADVHRDPVAERLTEQERALGAVAGAADLSVVSAPVRYRKLPHLLRFHSWAPVYLNPDGIERLSLDFNYQQVSLGATALFQNDLGTASGFVGYSAHEDPYTEGRWRHSGHAKLTYSGWYPVLEATVHFNDRSNIQYHRRTVVTAEETRRVTRTQQMGSPYLSGSLRLYVPLNFTKGGWLRGLIPSLHYSVSNDWYHTAEPLVSYEGAAAGGLSVPRFEGVTGGRNVPLQTFTGSLRGYIMRPRAASQVYPSLGIGAEAGYSGRPGMERILAPAAYGYAYGYLPGIVPQQGLKLTAIVQHRFGDGAGENHVQSVPRGYTSVAADYIARMSTTQVAVTADYAVPIYVGDLSFLSPVTYIRNFLLTPHIDYSRFNGGSLFSAGAALTAELSHFLWIPFDFSAGVSYSYNGGSYYEALQAGSVAVQRHSLSLVLSMDL